eukprot:s1165_g19.t1
MPASNIAALAGGLLFLNMQEVPLWMRVLYFAADVGVCIGRQRHALKDAGLIGPRKAGDEAWLLSMLSRADMADLPVPHIGFMQPTGWLKARVRAALKTLESFRNPGGTTCGDPWPCTQIRLADQACDLTILSKLHLIRREALRQVCLLVPPATIRKKCNERVLIFVRATTRSLAALSCGPG